MDGLTPFAEFLLRDCPIKHVVSHAQISPRGNVARMLKQAILSVMGASRRFITPLWLYNGSLDAAFVPFPLYTCSVNCWKCASNCPVNTIHRFNVGSMLGQRRFNIEPTLGYCLYRLTGHVHFKQCLPSTILTSISLALICTKDTTSILACTDIPKYDVDVLQSHLQKEKSYLKQKST